MLFLVKNNLLTQDRERTYLTANLSVAGTVLTVRGIDSNSWADNDWVIVGEIGSGNAEILQVNGTVTDGTSLPVDNAGSGGARFAHAVDEPVYRIDYNQMKVYRSTTINGAKTLLGTVEIQPDDFDSRYDDLLNSTGFGFVAFYNSATSGISPYSDAIPYAGQSQKTLYKMITKIRTLINEPTDEYITDQEIVDAINDKQRDIVNERLWTFNETETSASSVLNQFEYEISSTIKTTHTIRFLTQPLIRIGESRWEMLNWNTAQTNYYPTHCGIWDDKTRIYPRPGQNANSTTLDGAINATVTSITMTSTSGFRIGDFYRFIIDDEVIYATGLDPNDSNTFTGCLRAQEGTEAASHLDDATVTERDIVFTGQAYAVDLTGLNDETIVPEPIVICYGVAADFCQGKLNKETLGDRYDLKYSAGMDNLRDRFTLKITSQFNRVKAPWEVVNDNGIFENPNNYPYNVQAS